MSDFEEKFEKALAAAGETTTQTKERTYRLVAINEKTAKKTILSTDPLTHHEAVTMKSKFNPHRDVRLQLEEIEAPRAKRAPKARKEKPLDKVTLAAVAGYNGEENPHIYSSTMWYAHELGRYLKASGRVSPTDTRMSRGFSIRERDMLFKIEGGSKNTTFTRIS